MDDLDILIARYLETVCALRAVREGRRIVGRYIGEKASKARSEGIPPPSPSAPRRSEPTTIKHFLGRSKKGSSISRLSEESSDVVQVKREPERSRVSPASKLESSVSEPVQVDRTPVRLESLSAQNLSGRSVSGAEQVKCEPGPASQPSVDETIDSVQRLDAASSGSLSERRVSNQTLTLKRTPELIRIVQKRLLDRPDESQSSLSSLKRFKMNENTMSKLIHEDLRYKSYTRGVCRELSDEEKRLRADQSLELSMYFRSSVHHRLRFFCGRKIFAVDATIRCNRWLAFDPDDVPRREGNQSRPIVHVLGAISSQGDVMPPCFFREDEIVDEDVYLSLLEAVVAPWMKRVAGNVPFVFVQDGSLPFTSERLARWLRANVGNFVASQKWPVKGFDVNPLDYHIWGEIEHEINKSGLRGRESVTRAVKASFAKLRKNFVLAACDRFEKRLDAVTKTKGAFIG